MSVDSDDLLHPNLMLYDPSIPKEEAAVVKLRRDPDDAIEHALLPVALPELTHKFLSPRKRVSYYVDRAGNG